MEYRSFRHNVTPGRASWLERILAAIVTLALLVLGFSFLAAALVAGGILAAVILGRWWWFTRKLRRARDQDIVEGEYTIVRHSQLRDRATPPDQ